MSNTIISKFGIHSMEEKPTVREIFAADGLLMYGYRKVREKNGIGYIYAHKMKLGCEELAKHKGRWVYVDISDYWATTAVIGYSDAMDGIKYMGVKCETVNTDSKPPKMCTKEQK